MSDIVANDVVAGSDSPSLLQIGEPAVPVAKPNSGQFVKGQSGNPAGRPPGRKGEITALKQDLEVAIRSRIDARKIGRIVDKLINKAMNGNLQAAKLILDKVMSNAGETEDEQGLKGGIRIVIENATFAAKQAAAPKPPAIDGESTEVPQ